jgi:transposase
MDDQVQRIKYMKDVGGMSFRQIAKQLFISRKTVAKLYSGGPAVKRAPAGSKLDEYRSLIHHWFQEHPEIRAKQIWQRLVDRGVVISRRRVEEYTVELRRKKSKTYFELEFLPGEEAQVDWFFLNHPKLGKLCGFALVLSFSRWLFAHLFPRHGFEFFVEGHLMAFGAMGGLPRALRFDNLRTVILKRQPLTYNPAFLEFARHFGFEIRLCNPAAGNEKGRVERAIRTMREGFFNTATHIESLKAMNAALHEWVDAKNKTVHRGTLKTPSSQINLEKLRPLPLAPWINCSIHEPKRPTKTALVIFDSNRYSVPETCVNTLLTVRSYPDKIEVYDLKGNMVAGHPRCFERNKAVINLNHKSLKGISTAAKQERIQQLVRNLDPVVEQFLAINQEIGEGRYQSGYRIFKLLSFHSKGAVLSAIREAVKRKNCRMKFVLSLLEPREVFELEPVNPQKEELLSIHYTPRSLEEYDSER